MKTVGEKKGYTYSKGSYHESWTRGRTRYSVGRQYTGLHEYYECIVKTNLDTGEMVEASPEEHKKFLTPESYRDYLFTRFTKI